MSIIMYVHTYIYYACVHVYKYTSLNKKRFHRPSNRHSECPSRRYYAVFSFFFFLTFCFVLEYSQLVQLVKNPPPMQEIPVQFLGREDLLEKG